MRRREFIVGLGAAASSAICPPAALAQQRPAVPVIGYLSSRSSESEVEMLAAFRSGLAGIGYAEGRNVAIEYRFGGAKFDRLPALAMDLIDRHVAIIIFAGAGGNPSDAVWRPLRASNIPIVFSGGAGPDPVRSGLVSSFNRPGGNITGMFPLNPLMGKHMELVRELVPDAKTIAVLVTSQYNLAAELAKEEAREPAAALGVQPLFLMAGSEHEIEIAFAAMNQQRAEALLVATSPFFLTRAKMIASLAGHYRVPAIYARREYAEAGGLMSYGYDVADGYRIIGGYAGRILDGEKAGDLPVFQPSKFELVINLKTAKALGFEIPVKVLALADAVIR
jgi:putative tryptophan/tyrosine transport system substrate-binding protein